MDKTLEIVLVAVVLVVAAVIVVGLLQGQAGGFGSFADNQTNTASCGVAKSQFCSSLDSSGNPTDRSENIYNNNDPGCEWAESASDAGSVSC
jgi:hypothetical protein